MTLSADLIDAMLPADRPYKRSDEAGLYIEVRPNGKKWWRLRYSYEKKAKSLSLGVYPKVDLIEARILRDQNLELLDSGKDPSAVRKAEKQKSTYKPAKDMKQLLNKMSDSEKKDYLCHFNTVQKNKITALKEAFIKIRVDGYSLTKGYEKLEFFEVQCGDANLIIHRDLDWEDENVQLLLKDRYIKYGDDHVFARQQEVLENILYNKLKNPGHFSKLFQYVLWSEETVRALVRASIDAHRDYVEIKKRIEETEEANIKIAGLIENVINLIAVSKSKQLTLPDGLKFLSTLLCMSGYEGAAFFVRLNETDTTVEELLFSLKESFIGRSYRADNLDSAIDLSALKAGNAKAKCHFARTFKISFERYSDIKIKKGMKYLGLVLDAMVVISNTIFIDKKLKFTMDDFRKIL